MADDQAPEEPQEPAVVETGDGVEHEGVLPASAALPRRSGWFRSPGGTLTHADGPSQVRAFVDRGYTPVSDEEAVAEVGDGIELTVDRSGTDGTFDADAVTKAVAEESTSPKPRRRRTS